METFRQFRQMRQHCTFSLLRQVYLRWADGKKLIGVILVVAGA